MVTKKPTVDFMAMPSELPKTESEREARIARTPIVPAPGVRVQPVDQVTAKPVRRTIKSRTAVDGDHVFKTVVIKLSHAEYMLARKLQLSMEATGGAATSLAAIAKNEFLRLAQRKAGE